jgi:PAS domain S-box-containing protein
MEQTMGFDADNSTNSSSTLIAKPQDWLVDGGKMGELIRSMDWSKTSLGPIDKWPQSLRTTVSLCLGSNFPICLAWGPNYVQIYNDGYWPICGGKHPQSMGKDFRECWASAWPVVGEAFTVACAGETSFLENQRMFLDRNGYLEETFFTFSFSPIRVETGGIGGLFHPVTETTSQMLSERRARTLRDLATLSAKARTMEEACTLSAQTLAEHELDIPFLLLYVFDELGTQARLAAFSGLERETPLSPSVVNLQRSPPPGWPLMEIANSRQPQHFDDLEQRFGHVSAGPYPESLKESLALPIIPPGCERPVGILIAGVSSRLPLTASYRTFFDLVAAGVTTAVANALAREQERKRTEALAEIDRAKTVFFSNVSHEFRTPLTLMLGPLEDELAELANPLPKQRRERLETAHRNSLRLLKLVNTLLDFSRMEAGRVQASYVQTNLAEYTAELASSFRSAIEKAGLKLKVNCPALPEPVYVDQSMWEKIVLNLLSNAFKHTFEGSIAVTLSWCGDHVELAVTDSGVGIPAAALVHLFERFHRVEGARPRSNEGTGIGLALAKELVALHGGNIEVESEEDKGSTFRVKIKSGTAHLRADRLSTTAKLELASISTRNEAYIEEALQWLPNAGTPPDSLSYSQNVEVAISEKKEHSGLAERRSRILWADDNADMRDYVRRLLAEPYDVLAVPDGLTALAKAREEPPDLVLSDIMMPGLDGFGLLRELRSDPRTKAIPVILLSARAGEESSIEGLSSGADDYLVKPFSAKELLARVRTHLELARIRGEWAREIKALNSDLERRVSQRTEALRQSEEQLRSMISGVKDYAIFMIDPEGCVVTWNLGCQRLKGWSAEEIIGQSFSRFHSPAEVADGLPQRELEIARTHGQFAGEGWRIRKDGSRFWAGVATTPILSADGRLLGFSKVIRDTTGHRRIEQAMKEEEARLAAVIGSAMDAVITVDENQRITLFNPAAERMFGYTPEFALGRALDQLIPERFRAAHACHIGKFADTNVSRRKMGALIPIFGLRANGEEFPIEVSISQVQVAGRKIFTAILRDITERLAAEEARKTSETNFAMLLNHVPQFVWTCTPEGLNTYFNDRWYAYTGLTPEESYGRGWNAPFHPHDRQSAQDALNHATATGGLYNIESRLRSANGSYRWFLMRGEPVRDADGNIGKWFGTCTDIDVMKCAQEALFESEQRFQLMANSIPQLAWMAQSDGHIFWYNQRWYDYTGKTLEQMEGWGWQSVHDPEVLPTVLAKWKSSIAEGEPFNMEFPLLGADGQFHDFLTRGVPLKDSEGHVTRWFGTNTDISEIKKSQALQLRSQKLESLGTLSGGIAHDFNNILMAINGNAKLAVDDLPPDHPVQMSLAEITKAGARATDLVRRILTFSRPSEIKRQSISLEPVVEEALKLVRATLPASIEFRTEFSTSVPTVLADSTQIHQIIVNLATNAAHAIGARSDGRIEIRLDFAQISAAAPKSTLNLPEGDYVRLCVLDNGNGMDHSTLDRIFDPFFTTKAPGEGTGLGLAVVHGIMKNHDGGIFVRSEPGQGTEFQLYFPSAGTSVPTRKDAPLSATEKQRKETVLYVDDEEGLILLIARMLGRLGYKVTGETDPVRALELFRSNPRDYDVVVTDLAMPQLSGFDLSAQLLAIRPDIPIVMTSGFVRPQDYERAMELGLRDLILKSTAVDDLSRALDRIFRYDDLGQPLHSKDA